MERVAKVLRRLPMAGCVTPEQLAVAAWPAAVGRKIAARTRAMQVVRGKLIVEVEDYVWQSQLWPLRQQILANLESLAGKGIVSALEFRLAVPRRMPQREAEPVRGGDEADRIADPILSRIYRINRQRFGT